MSDKLDAVVRSTVHAVGLIANRTAEVDVRWLLAGTLLYVLAQATRTRAWFNILRAAYPEADGLHARHVARAYLAGAGINALVPARGGDVVKLAMVRRRIEGARYTTLAATFIPETIFETAFGSALVVWALLKGFMPVPTADGEMPSLDVSLVVEHPLPALAGAAVVSAAAWWLVRRVRAPLRQG